MCAAHPAFKYQILSGLVHDSIIDCCILAFQLSEPASLLKLVFVIVKARAVAPGSGRSYNTILGSQCHPLN